MDEFAFKQIWDDATLWVKTNMYYSPEPVELRFVMQGSQAFIVVMHLGEVVHETQHRWI